MGGWGYWDELVADKYVNVVGEGTEVMVWTDSGDEGPVFSCMYSCFEGISGSLGQPFGLGFGTQFHQ